MTGVPERVFPFAGLSLRNPLVLLSGTAGFGRRLSRVAALDLYGALIGKTITLRPREGNRPPRTFETPAGLVNSIGLENPGLEVFLEREVPEMEKAPLACLASIAGTARELGQLARALEGTGLPGVEVNLSCPNIGADLRHFEPESVTGLLEKVRAAFSRTVLAKLPPDIHRIGALARAAEKAGVDALTVANTFPALVFDTSRGVPALGGVTGGLSGPAILPVSLYLVYQARRATGLPILGSGGIHDAASARSMILAGANALGLGTILFRRPDIGARIMASLEPGAGRTG